MDDDVDLDRSEGGLRRVYWILLASRYAAQAIVLFGIPAILGAFALVLVSLMLNMRGIPLFGSDTYFYGFLAGYAAFLLVAYGIAALTRRLARAAAALWALVIGWQIYAIAATYAPFLSPGTFDNLMTWVAAASPATRALIAGAVLVVGVTVHAYLLWLQCWGVAALLRLRADEKARLREADPETHMGLRSLIVEFGLPQTLEFVRKPVRRFAFIAVCAIVQALAFAGGLWLLMILPSAWQFVGQYACGRPPCAHPPLVWLAAYGLAAGGGLALLASGRATQRLMRRMVRLSLDDLLQHDARQPILWLRAFRDDQVPLRPSALPFYARLLEAGRRRANLDELLLEEATPYGPVVTLGKPGDPYPPYGAARTYLAVDGWQDVVARLAGDAAAVVVCLDDTAGVWWETELLAARRHLWKTLFLVHPRHAAPAANAALMARLEAALGAEAAPTRHATTGPRPPVIGLYWAKPGPPRVLRSRTFSRFAYLLALREFLRGKPALRVTSLPAY